MNEKQVQSLLAESLLVIRQFDRLIDSYVLDFYVDDHWNKLPSSWKSCFEYLDPQAFSELLNSKNKNTVVWPLSILSLKVLTAKLCISRDRREKINNDVAELAYLKHSKVKHIFTKCVKPKKLHEIENMTKICAKSAKLSSTRFVVDFGAGLGHLARRLTYGYGLKVCCLEMQDDLNKQARVIDQQFHDRTNKFLDGENKSFFNLPLHVTIKLTKDMTPDDFLKCIRNAFDIKDSDEFTFGIVGLHPCGDLAAILINQFLNCHKAKYLNIIGCCYMKLTTNLMLSEYQGYPLSEFLTNKSESLNRLSYESREIACHAIENYYQRLHNGNYEDLKVHSYRATLEKIIIKYWPHLKHSGLKSIKHIKLLSFQEYSKNAVQHLNINIPDDDVNSEETLKHLTEWKNIVIYYTLRLIFAPLIESILLYDRFLYLHENGCEVVIEAIFDPFISPRNHIMAATKKSQD